MNGFWIGIGLFCLALAMETGLTNIGRGLHELASAIRRRGE